MDRETLIRAILECNFAGYDSGIIDIAVKRIMENTVDAVEVVRCKDCKHEEHWYGDKGRCFLWVEDGIDVFEDGYCNYGERREDEE